MNFHCLRFSFLIIAIWPFQTVIASDGLLELLPLLRDQRIISEIQYKRLSATVENNVNALDEEAISQLNIKTKGGLEIASYDGQFAFELGGRLMLDMVHYDESLNTLGDGTELRQARIDMEGSIYADWAYEFAVDFADKNVDIKDAYISYMGFYPMQLQIGHFKEPFGLERLTSSKYISFMERGLLNEFTPGRNIGVGVRQYQDSWTFAGGIFGEAFDGDADSEGNEGWAVTGRLTYSPWHNDLSTLHFGGALSRRWTSDEDTVKFDARPESHITDVKYLNTGKLSNTDSVDLIGLEAALVSGSWSLQSEYVLAKLNRDDGFSEPEFSGWYLFGSWFLTGESRNYKFKKGTFGQVNPGGRRGAVELVARYSTLDMDDADITGGRERNWTLGINWHINSQVRLMANYILVNNNINADDNGDVFGNDDPALFQTRFQIDF